MGWIFSLSIFLLAVVGDAEAIRDMVNTTSGVVKGQRISFQSKTVYEFRMVPYAEPPVGELRFKPPKPKSRETEVIDGTKLDYITCPQNFPPVQVYDLMRNLALGNAIMNESCLFLDIYVPETAVEDNRLAVMVWIHGGAYIIGAGRLTSGRPLAALHDVIIVTINYRLGALGFFTTGDQNAEGDFGILDQILALKWVNDNIGEFGGDVNRITIAGESAGADAVALLTVSPKTQGLFQRAIIQSGGMDNLFSCSQAGDVISKEYALSKNCSQSNGEGSVQCLREKSAEDLATSQATWAPSCTGTISPFTYKQLTTTAMDSDIAKSLAGIDVMVGVNAQEGGLYTEFMEGIWLRNQQGAVEQLSTSLLSAPPLDFQQKEISSLIPALEFQYTDWQKPNDAIAQRMKLVDYAGDVLFYVGAVKYKRLHSKIEASTKGSSYLYLLKPRPSWLATAPWRIGADHLDDLFFFFGDPLQFPQLNATEGEKLLSQTAMAYWANFIKSGNPNSPSTIVEGKTLVEWPQFDTETESYLSLDINMTSESVGRRLFARRIAFWTEFVPAELNRIRSLKPPQPCASGSLRNPTSSILVPVFITAWMLAFCLNVSVV